MNDAFAEFQKIIEHHDEVMAKSMTHIRQRTTVLQRIDNANKVQDGKALRDCFNDLIDLVMAMGEDASDLVTCNLETIQWIQKFVEESK